MSSSIVPFLSSLQSFPVSGVFPNESVLCIRWPKSWNFSFSICPSCEYSGLISFRIGLDFFFPCHPRDSQESSPTPQFKSINSLMLSFLYGPILTPRHDYWKNHRQTCFNQTDLFWQSMPLLFNMLSRFVIAFLPRSKCLLISWLQSPSAVILEPKKIKSVIVSTASPSICYEVMGLVVMNLVFWMSIFKLAFSLSSFTFIKKAL